MKITLFYVPCGSEANAMSIGQAAIDKKLAACIHVFPIQSAYPWQGQLQNDQEFILIAKTFPDKINSLMDHIRGMHSYEIPAILHWEVEANEEYIEWMKSILSEK